MMKWLRKHRYTIFLITIGGFLIGSFMGFGSYFFSQSPYDAAITVNGEKISYKRYQTRHRQYLQQVQEQKITLDQEKMKALQQQVVQDLVREVVFLKEADKYGVIVTDNELAAYIQGAKAFQKDGQFDQATYFQVVSQVLRTPPDEFEEDRRREIKIQKMQALMASTIKLSDLEYNWGMQKALATAASDKDRKAIMEKPEEFKEQLRQEQVTNSFQQWLTQVNGQLKVQVYLDRFEGKNL